MKKEFGENNLSASWYLVRIGATHIHTQIKQHFTNIVVTISRKFKTCQKKK